MKSEMEAMEEEEASRESGKSLKRGGHGTHVTLKQMGGDRVGDGGDHVGDGGDQEERVVEMETKDNYDTYV